MASPAPQDMDVFPPATSHIQDYDVPADHPWYDPTSHDWLLEALGIAVLLIGLTVVCIR